MRITPRHREVESSFRRLVEDADLPEPDEVDYGPDCVVFSWHGPKVAVAVDFDHPDEASPDDLGAAVAPLEKLTIGHRTAAVETDASAPQQDSDLVSDTYWYLTGIPEPMAIAAQRFEHFAHDEQQGGS